jgi:hypothetical protein
VVKKVGGVRAMREVRGGDKFEFTGRIRRAFTP